MKQYEDELLNWQQNIEAFEKIENSVFEDDYADDDLYDDWDDNYD